MKAVVIALVLGMLILLAFVFTPIGEDKSKTPPPTKLPRPTVSSTAPSSDVSGADLNIESAPGVEMNSARKRIDEFLETLYDELDTITEIEPLLHDELTRLLKEDEVAMKEWLYDLLTDEDLRGYTHLMISACDQSADFRRALAPHAEELFISLMEEKKSDSSLGASALLASLAEIDSDKAVELTRKYDLRVTDGLIRAATAHGASELIAVLKMKESAGIYSRSIVVDASQLDLENFSKEWLKAVKDLPPGEYYNVTPNIFKAWVEKDPQGALDYVFNLSDAVELPIHPNAGISLHQYLKEYALVSSPGDWGSLYLELKETEGVSQYLSSDAISLVENFVDQKESDQFLKALIEVDRVYEMDVRKSLIRRFDTDPFAVNGVGEEILPLIPFQEAKQIMVELASESERSPNHVENQVSLLKAYGLSEAEVDSFLSEIGLERLI